MQSSGPTTRERARLRARTTGEGAISRRVEVRDVAVGGSYVAAVLRPEEHQAPHLGLVVADGLVHIEFPAPANFVDPRAVDSRTTLIEVAGRPARTTERGFGLAVADDYSELVRALIGALVGQAATDAATKFAQQDSAQDSEEPLIGSVRDAVLDRLLGYLRRFADQAEARLVALASKSHSNAEQTSFFDAIAELKRRTSSLEGIIVNTIGQRLDNLGQALQVADEADEADEAGATGTGPLSLVEKDEFEIYLTVADMASKAEHRLDDELFRLGRLLSTLADCVIDGSNNPIGPSRFTDPFHDYMNDAPLAPESLGIVYRSFE